MNLRTGIIIVLVTIVVFIAMITRLPGVTGGATSGVESVLARPNSPDSVSTPVLVELFTSEGYRVARPRMLCSGAWGVHSLFVRPM